MSANPDRWPRVSVAEVCLSIVDCVNKTAPVVDEPTPFKMIRTTNVRDGWVDLSSVRCVSESTYEKWTRRQRPARGDVILTREAPLGEVGMLRSDECVFLGQRLVAYRADPAKLDNRFLLYAMLGDDLQGQIRSLGSGATVEHMRVPDCEKLTLQLPPLQEQRRIASILSAYDDLIENNTRRIAILEEMTRCIYEDWFVRLRFPGHERVRMVESELGPMPEDWRLSTLDQVLENVRLATKAGEHLSERKYVPIECIGRKKLSLPEFRPWTEAQSSLVLFEEDDVLFGAMRAYFHKVCVAPFAGITRTTCFVLRPRRPELRAFGTLTAFAEATVNYAAKHSQGATIPYAVWEGSLSRMPVLVPSEELLRSFESLVSPMIAWIKTATMRQHNLRTVRNLLLPKLVSGELDVSELPAAESTAA